MIPKKIHYCWFGRNPLPDSARKCIASWRKYLPEYEIIEWNEDNFDVNSIPYTAEAYEAKKYAFVSDYARFKILYDHGGLYFDTDVEVIRPMDDIIARGAFMGVEVPGGSDGTSLAVNPGLGLGVAADNALYAEIIDFYSTHNFLTDTGEINMYAVVRITTDFLLKHGLRPTNELQEVAGITIYPADYFNPLDDATGRLNKTANTRSIHWYSKTWLYNRSRMRTWLSRMLHRIIGIDTSSRLRKTLFGK